MNIQINSGQRVEGASNSLSWLRGKPGISDAFRTELSSVLESTLERIRATWITKSEDPASTTGQASQNLVATLSTPPPSTITNPPSTSVAAPATTEAPTPAATPSTSTTVTSSPSVDDEANYDDTYWANQPAAVQQLRDIKDPDKRGALATQLAADGYKIDVPIMMWGWDPAKTTAMRESFGYTWVPSAYQAPVEVAPGVSFPPMASYDPKNPPPNSIQVG